MKIDQPPKIITFYSYKGGTGRTMLLANVAWILASNGKRVLVVDWDLEAPGLHRYFAPFLVDKDLSSSPGLVDLVTDFAVQAMTSPAAEEDGDWHERGADVTRFASSLTWAFPEPGTIDLLPAGRQGPSYAVRVNSFNWQNFYDRLAGGAFLETVKKSMRQEYDYVLIDSRTGVSDTAGICTVQMPDALVVCFTLNHQSIEGASAIAHSVALQRPAPFRIYPVPTRVEDGEKMKLELARDSSREKFAEFIAHLSEAGRSQYWGGVEVPYKIFYAYEEILATFGDRPDQVSSLLARAECLTSYLTRGAVTRLAGMPEQERLRGLLAFERTRPSASEAPETPRPTALNAIIDAADRVRAQPPGAFAPPPAPANHEDAAPITLRGPPATGGIAESPLPRAGAASLPRTPAETVAAARKALTPYKSVIGLASLIGALVIGRQCFPVAPDRPTAGDVSAGTGSAIASQRDASPEAPGRDLLANATGAADPLLRMLLLAEIEPNTSGASTGAALAAARTLVANAVPIAVLRGHKRELVGAKFSSDGKTLVTGALDGTVRVWAADGRGPPVLLDAGAGPVSCFDVSRDGALVAIGTADGASGVWSRDDKLRPLRFSRQNGRIVDVRFNAEGSMVVVASEGGAAHVWYVGKGQAIVGAGAFSITSSEGLAQAMFDGSDVVTVSASRVSVWRANGKRPDPPLDPLYGSPIHFDADPRPPAAPALSGLRVKTLQLSESWTSPKQATWTVALAPDGCCAVAAANDGKLHIWSVGDTAKPPLVATGQRGAAGALAIQGDHVASGTLDGAVQVWQLGGPPHDLGGHLKAVRSIAFSPDAGRIVTASDDGTARVLTVTGDKEIVLKGSGAPLVGASFSPDGARVVTYATDHEARVWRVDVPPEEIPADWPGMTKYLRDSTTACLTAVQRTKYLAQPAAEARAANEQCERGYDRTPAPPDGAQ